MSGRLNNHLAEIDGEAQERFEALIEQMKQARRMDRKNSMCKRIVELKDTQLKKKINNSSIEKT